MKKLLLENTTCGRCCGSGLYGPRCVAGGICFSCGGRGAHLTKRGRVAQIYLDGLHTIPAGELQVGQSYNATGVTNAGGVFHYWAKITSILRDGDKLEVQSTSRYQNLCEHMSADAPVKVARTAAEVAETRELALAFQKLLTKRGTIRAVDMELTHG